MSRTRLASKAENVTGTRPLDECRLLCTSVSFGSKDPSIRATLEATVKEVVYNPFGRPLTASELTPLIGDIDGCIAGIDEMNAHVLAAAPRLRVIAVYGAGYDKVDVAEATRRGIVVANSPGANSTAVAELAIAFMLALARNLKKADKAVSRGEWPVLDGIGIKGKTIGLVGFGSIGREVAVRLNCFGCRVMVYDPYVQTEAARDAGVLVCTLDELLQASDFVSLHAILNESTRGMVDAAFFGRMKKGSFFINTARGALIDEQALREAIEKGHLRGAALDCLRQEPPEKDNPLLRFPQVIVTPHTGSHTDESIDRMSRTAMENCLSVLRGGRPLHPVNPEVLEQVT